MILRNMGEVQRALIGVNIKDVESDDADKLKLRAVKGVLITRVTGMMVQQKMQDLKKMMLL